MLIIDVNNKNLSSKFETYTNDYINDMNENNIQSDLSKCTLYKCTPSLNAHNVLVPSLGLRG